MVMINLATIQTILKIFRLKSQDKSPVGCKALQLGCIALLLGCTTLPVGCINYTVK